MLYGQDEQWRFYVGQSSNLRETIHQKTQHPDPSGLVPSLHQYAAAQSKWDAFVILAVLPKSLPLDFHQTEEKKILLINVLEMWCALLFHTLQQKDMQRWHMYRRYGHSGTDGKRPWHGLNIASPLAQGSEGRKADGQWAQHCSEILATSDDPLAKAYAEALATPSKTKVEQPPEPPVKLAISPAPLPAPRGPRADELAAARRSSMVIGAAIGFGVSFFIFSCLGMREGRRW